MHETESLVINTGPLLALMAGYGDLSLLENIFTCKEKLEEINFTRKRKDLMWILNLCIKEENK